MALIRHESIIYLGIIVIRKKLVRYAFDTSQFPFREVFMTHINKLLGSDNLEEIQNLIPQNKRLKQIVSVSDDQSTWIHKELYKVDPYYDLTSKNPSKGKFIKLYDKFVNWLGNEYFSENLIYQRKPTIRVHLVGNMSVGGYHRDSEYNHPKEEFNVWVPLH